MRWARRIPGLQIEPAGITYRSTLWGASPKRRSRRTTIAATGVSRGTKVAEQQDTGATAIQEAATYLQIWPLWPDAVLDLTGSELA